MTLLGSNLHLISLFLLVSISLTFSSSSPPHCFFRPQAAGLLGRWAELRPSRKILVNGAVALRRLAPALQDKGTLSHTIYSEWASHFPPPTLSCRCETFNFLLMPVEVLWIEIIANAHIKLWLQFFFFFYHKRLEAWWYKKKGNGDRKLCDHLGGE